MTNDSPSSEKKLRALADRLMADVVYAVGSGANSNSEERDLEEFVLVLVECAEQLKALLDDDGLANRSAAHDAIAKLEAL